MGLNDLFFYPSSVIKTLVLKLGIGLFTAEAKQPCELRASSIEVEGASTADYPLQKKRHSLEFLRTIAHLRPPAAFVKAIPTAYRKAQEAYAAAAGEDEEARLLCAYEAVTA